MHQLASISEINSEKKSSEFSPFFTASEKGSTTIDALAPHVFTPTTTILSKFYDVKTDKCCSDIKLELQTNIAHTQNLLP